MKKTLRISFNGKSYEVVAEILDGGSSAAAPPSRGVAASAAAAAPPPSSPSPAPTTASAAGEIPSPLAGKIVSIAAQTGAAVKAGQAIITLEAMKMNTVVAAPQDGTVAAIHVTPGDTVEEGQLLMTLR